MARTAKKSALPYEDLASSFIVRHVQTPMHRVTAFDTNDQAGKAGEILTSHNWDYAPVLKEGTVIGRVAAQNLSANPYAAVGDHVEAISMGYIVTAQSRLADLMQWLVNDPWLLVVDGRDVSGLVTAADLNRQPARAYMYMLLADFELRLAEVVRSAFADQRAALLLLSNDQQAKINGLMNKALKGGVESDWVSMMGLSHLIQIGAASAEVRQPFGLTPTEEWQKKMVDMIDSRDAIAHPTKPLISSTDDVKRLVGFDSRLRNLLEADVLS